VQYLLRCVMVATSSLRSIKRLEGVNGVDADSDMLLR
jgi:hypothetical protein